MGRRWEVLLAIPGIVLACSSGARAQSCEPAAASVISVQGEVEVSGHDRAHWRDVQLHQVLCGGQQVRLKAKSRAVLQLRNETLIHFDEGSIFTLRAIEPQKPAWLDLLQGALHIISRVPRALNIRTPFVNAGIEGTEFALRVDPALAELWVFEGRVRFSNPRGQLLIASGEAAAASPGRAPERRIVIKPRRAVEWALYYPPLLDSRPQSYPEALRPAVLAYRRNDLPAAFAALEGVPEAARDARYHTLRAGLLLSVGRVPEAQGDLRSAARLDPKNGIVYALRSVIAVVRNEQEEALKLAAEAVRLAPGSATPYVARSYTEQSAFEIEKAHESLEKAAELAPEDALVWARLAELELSLGDLDAALEAATKAEQLDPGLSRTQTVLGFAYLTRIEVDHAKTAFERAIALDPADPLPRLGLGLAKIRDGEVDEGTKEIEIAASLDPNDSLIRSYLGKAYYEQKRGGIAETEFEQAKLLDPNDPTPWFYDAIQKQTTNRPVEALHDLQKAIDLNDNRAVYRSRLLLDQDLAARSAALGRIYRDLGFEQLALVQGWKSVQTDPSDYSGHRLLADTYSALPRHEIARVSELLQSQLLQPINITPLQPSLGETNLLILEDSGPSSPAFNEFNPFFTRNGLALQASGVFGANDTVGNEIVQSGIWGKYSYSLGQFHFETDGFRDNNDLKTNLYNAFLQATLSPSTSAQVEVRYSDQENGDLPLRFDPSNFFQFRDGTDTKHYRVGFRHRLNVRSDVLASVIFQDIDSLARAVDRLFLADTEASSRTFELQNIYRTKYANVISGVGRYDLDVKSNGQFLDFEQEPPRIVPFADDVDGFGNNAYLYTQLNPGLFNLRLDLGVSYDRMEGLAVSRSQVNPKVGLIWSPASGTTIRAAAFKVVKRDFTADRTIEPTVVAGFNQFYDDLNGTIAKRAGFAVDQKLTEHLYGGFEISGRNLSRVPFISVGEFNWQERNARTYLYWTPHDWFTAVLEYQNERFKRLDEHRGPEDFTEVETHEVPISFRLFHPSGVSAGITVRYVDQQGTFVDAQQSRFDGDDRFWSADVSLSYRLPKRFGRLTIQARNLWDEKFNFQETSLATPSMARDQIILGGWTFAF